MLSTVASNVLRWVKEGGGIINNRDRFCQRLICLGTNSICDSSLSISSRSNEQARHTYMYNQDKTVAICCYGACIYIYILYTHIYIYMICIYIYI